MTVNFTSAGTVVSSAAVIVASQNIVESYSLNIFILPYGAEVTELKKTSAAPVPKASSFT